MLHDTRTHLTALCPGLPRWSSTRKVKPIWILLKQETVSGSGISWAICKSATRSRQITTPALHYSSFLQARCPSCCPTNSVKALKAYCMTVLSKSGKYRVVITVHLKVITIFTLPRQGSGVLWWPCLCVWVCLRTYLWKHMPDLYHFLCILPMAVAWSFSASIAIRYVLPVLWMTLYLHISQGSSAWLPSWWKHSPNAAMYLSINAA